MGNISTKNCPFFGKLSTKSMPLLIHQPTAVNQKAIMTSLWFFSLLKISTETMKYRKHHRIKSDRPYFTAILSKS